jgi:uncharacterized membrane protein YfcA
MFATLFTLGGVLSILGGLAGDWLQRRTPRGRALVATVGILAGAVLASVVSEPTVALSFVTALVALALTSANAPNWFARTPRWRRSRPRHPGVRAARVIVCR